MINMDKASNYIEFHGLSSHLRQLGGAHGHHGALRDRATWRTLPSWPRNSSGVHVRFFVVSNPKPGHFGRLRGKRWPLWGIPPSILVLANHQHHCEFLDVREATASNCHRFAKSRLPS